MRYNCSFSGKCEEDIWGPYLSPEECECKSIENKDVNYMIYEYNPAAAIFLAPSDKAIIAKRLLSVTIPTDRVDIALELSLIKNNDVVIEIINLDDDKFYTYVDKLGPTIGCFRYFAIKGKLDIYSPLDENFNVKKVDYIINGEHLSMAKQLL